MYFPVMMRYVFNLILIGSTLSTTGCSALIARSGVDLSKLTDKEKVHEKFGEPIASGVADGKTFDGKTFEEFHTRQKIPDAARSSSYGFSLGMTLGLAEVMAFPLELCILGKTTLVGQNLRFTYNSYGRVVQVDLEGKYFNDDGDNPATNPYAWPSNRTPIIAGPQRADDTARITHPALPSPPDSPTP